jgi:pyruvate/2-oxoglutarate dehydrogenase complex dihydrolipoamide acyltransferase (E2) component
MRTNKDAKLTMVAFLIKASALALKAYPRFNASLDGDELVLKNYVHIGFAADTPKGLMVPVIRDCDRKGVLEIATEMRALADKARGKRAVRSRHAGRLFFGVLAWRDWRGGLYANHQCAGGGDPRRRPLGDGSHLGR